jgi:hypothetical protein
MSRTGIDLSKFVDLWRSCKKGSSAEAKLLLWFKCGFKTAYRVLGPKTSRKSNRRIRITRPVKSLEENGFTHIREKELLISKRKWERIALEAEQVKRESANVYKGEMYPEGAPLRAVGL